MPADDVVFFDDLALRVLLGVNDDEKAKAQDILVSVRIGTDTRRSAASGRLEDAADYRAIKKQMIRTAEEHHHGLVETLAEELAQDALSSPNARWVTVRVEKPGALRHARTVGVEITRHKEP